MLEPRKKCKLEAGLVHFATVAAVRNYRVGPFRDFFVAAEVRIRKEGLIRSTR